MESKYKLNEYRGYFYQLVPEEKYVVLDEDLNNKGYRENIEECEEFIDELIERYNAQFDNIWN